MIVQQVRHILGSIPLKISESLSNPSNERNLLKSLPAGCSIIGPVYSLALNYELLGCAYTTVFGCLGSIYDCGCIIIGLYMFIIGFAIWFAIGFMNNYCIISYCCIIILAISGFIVWLLKSYFTHCIGSDFTNPISFLKRLT